MSKENWNRAKRLGHAANIQFKLQAYDPDALEHIDWSIAIDGSFIALPDPSLLKISSLHGLFSLHGLVGRRVGRRCQYFHKNKLYPGQAIWNRFIGISVVKI